MVNIQYNLMKNIKHIILVFITTSILLIPNVSAWKRLDENNSIIKNNVLNEQIEKIKNEKNDYWLYLIIISLSIILSVITFVFKKNEEWKK